MCFWASLSAVPMPGVGSGGSQDLPVHWVVWGLEPTARSPGLYILGCFTLPVHGGDLLSVHGRLVLL